MDNLFSKQALEYHSQGRPGKLEVVPTKPYSTQKDLSLAYTPGVAKPCLEIQKNPEDVYKYTMKGNLVAVISNGTAVLGLGDIGPEAGKPVMEGKGLLFKVFADLDVFDIEVNQKDIDKFVETVIAIAPTFGGINLEDIKAPECFEIEDRIKEALDIPVMHDDQHGTAIITAAGLLNALEITGQQPDGERQGEGGMAADEDEVGVQKSKVPHQHEQRENDHHHREHVDHQELRAQHLPAAEAKARKGVGSRQGQGQSQ